MNLEILCICKSANAHDGILDISGIYNRLPLSKFPTNVPSLTVAIRIRFSVDEEGEHSFRLIATDLDGKLLGPPAQGSFAVGAEGDESHAWISAVTTIPNLIIGGPNDCLIDFQIDGKSIGTTILVIIEGK